MFVTFPHRSIQEFLGAFYFILMLSAGESIESLLGSDCKEQIFMMNPLFFHFCLWFLYSDQKYFTFGNKDQVCKRLVNLCYGKVSLHTSFTLDLIVIKQSFPALDVEQAFRLKDPVSLPFFQDVLQRYKAIKKLIMDSFAPLKWFLSPRKFHLKFVRARGLLMHWIKDRVTEIYIFLWRPLLLFIRCLFTFS